MTLKLSDTFTLNNGVKIPALGLGTFKAEQGDETEQAILDAFELGYRHIDTASLYNNEETVGKAFRVSGLAREEVFITSKVWNDDQRSGNVARALESTLQRLGMDYVDLYLVHWPVPGKFVATYRVLENLARQGKARAIGVSNFLIPHLDELAAEADVAPAVNQIEWHPFLQSRPLLERCKRDGIIVEAWAPIMKGKVNDVPEILEIAKRHNKTPVQVTLRWGLQNRVVMIPKSVRRERIEENADLYDFQLSADEMATMNALDKNERIGPDPSNVTF
jgi:diketogulonate reductase-like aldo/keto reductase